MEKSEPRKVIEAYTRDVGRGIIRVNAETIKKLNLLENDPVLIKGKQTTAGRIKRLYPSDTQNDFFRMDGLMRNNAGIINNEYVTIEKTDFVHADHISIEPLDNWPPIDEMYPPEALKNIAMCVNDYGRIPYFGGRLTFRLKNFEPKSEIAIIT